MEEGQEILLTANGLKKIECELEQLRTVHRKRVADRIRDAKQFGEFSENSEYEDAKTEQAFVEGRIEELKIILAYARVIELAEVSTSRVGVGSVVKIRDLETGDEWEYTIVGPVEVNPVEDMISNESPVGQSLLEKEVGDKVEVDIPAGRAQYEIIGIRK